MLVAPVYCAIAELLSARTSFLVHCCILAQNKTYCLLRQATSFGEIRSIPRFYSLLPAERNNGTHIQAQEETLASLLEAKK
jgi:hypothetical protein